MKETRGLIIHPEELDETWRDRLLDAGITVLGLHPVGGPGASASLEAAVQRRELPETRALFRQLNRAGIQVEYEAHAMSWLMPRALFDAKPEWFRANEAGERVSDINLCPSNEEALAYIERRAETLARLLDTGSDRYFFWLDDVKDGQCHCPRCRSLSASDQQMLAVNAMLRGARRFNRQAKMCFLAYFHTVRPPETVEPSQGVFLEFAPFQRDHHRPLFDPACAENAREVASVDALLDCFGRKDSQALEYWIDNSKFSMWRKPPKELVLDEAVMRGDVAEYRARGFECLTSFGCFLGADYRALYGEPPIRAYGDILRGR